MVACSRHTGNLSRPRIPFVNGEPGGRNMDICPDEDRGRVAQGFDLEHQAVDGSGRRMPNINQQSWPTDQMGWTGNGQLSRPRWVSGGT